MEIIIKTLDGSAMSEIGSRFQFPSLPSEITVKNGANYQTYKIIGRGEVKIPRGIKSEEISWNGYFFGPSKRGELMIQYWTAPRLCIEILERLRNNGTPLNLMCTDVGINRDVTISDFQWEPYGGHGNVKYKIIFAKWHNLKVKVLKTADTDVTPNSAADTPEERPEQSDLQTYTVVKGDSLWRIAQKFLGSGTRWQELIPINLTVLDEAARKYGHKDSNNGYWLFAGTVLTIPPK